MVTTTETKNFHGMKVISDIDCVSVRDHHVLELNSSANFVVRYYDEQGVEDDEPVVFEVLSFVEQNLTESKITGKIKREVGINNLLISNGAVDLIKNLVSKCSK